MCHSPSLRRVGSSSPIGEVGGELEGDDDGLDVKSSVLDGSNKASMEMVRSRVRARSSLVDVDG